MTDLRQAAQQALEYMKSVGQMDMYPEEWAIVERLEAALAQRAAPQPEPVAFYDFGNHKMRWAKPTTYDQLVSVDVPELPLYTAPPQRQPLTDLSRNEQYRLQMAGICTAAIGYWKENNDVHPDYDTPALRDVAKLYAKYAALTAQRDALLEALEAMTDAFRDIEGSPSSLERDALNKAYAAIDAARSGQ